MNDCYETLRQFFGAHFHQDWDLEGAASWEDVVRQFLKESPKWQALMVRDALRWWAGEISASPLQPLPASFDCEYSPRLDGFTDREWVERIADLLDEELSAVPPA